MSGSVIVARGGERCFGAEFAGRRFARCSESACGMGLGGLLTSLLTTRTGALQAASAICRITAAIDES